VAYIYSAFCSVQFLLHFWWCTQYTIQCNRSTVDNTVQAVYTVSNTVCTVSTTLLVVVYTISNTVCTVSTTLLVVYTVHNTCSRSTVSTTFLVVYTISNTVCTVSTTLLVVYTV
ncbi:hypothetical protein AB205_0160480, partial [Aquarana catesbeiana]